MLDFIEKRKQPSGYNILLWPAGRIPELFING